MFFSVDYVCALIEKENMNLKTNVIAAEVGNLTDARYFAAWGVDYITYHLDSTAEQFMGVEAIREIIEWVEGPVNMGYISGLNISEALVMDYQSLGLSGLVANSFLETEKLYEISNKVYKEVTDISLLANMSEELIIVKLSFENKTSNYLAEIKSAAQNNEVYIDGVQSLVDLQFLLEETNPTGIVLRGGEEEKVGFKSYDELDEIFEWLEVD